MLINILKNAIVTYNKQQSQRHDTHDTNQGDCGVEEVQATGGGGTGWPRSTCISWLLFGVGKNLKLS